MKVRDILALAPLREVDPSPAGTNQHASIEAPSPLRKRPFLPRPLGQEDAPDPWEVWTPLFDWLIEHHPEHFHAVCDAEDALHRMERNGITNGEAYEAACRDLYVKFETARRLKLQAGVKVWIQ